MHFLSTALDSGPFLAVVSWETVSSTAASVVECCWVVVVDSAVFDIVGEEGRDGSSDSGECRGDTVGNAVQCYTFCFFSIHILAGISGIGEITELVVAAFD